MVRKAQKLTIDRAKAINYKIVAENFYDGALAAVEYEYWNAAGVLIVHSAIAYGDAVTIKFGGVKSKGENHQALVNLLESLIPDSSAKKKALLQLYKIIDYKNAVSYSGDIYERADIDQLWKYLDRFRLAEQLLL
ncbi:MAG: hypothetical protein P4L27_14860 [Ignavibacteriaceae bacterium]|nr:hypothetical protein [Ignavibacteriaceae bacterium]